MHRFLKRITMANEMRYGVELAWSSFKDFTPFYALHMLWRSVFNK
jgi:hypothetical protein